MTCIVAIAENGKVYMGGDSAAAAGWDIRTTAQPKVFRKGDILIGYTSSFRMGQLLQYQLDIPKQGDEQTDYAYMVSVFAEAVRELLKEHGYAKIDSNREEVGTFLVGYKGKVYVLQTDLAVIEHGEGYDAIGCGSDYALGALAALPGREPEERILEALKISAHFSNGVCGPFVVEEMQ